MNETISKVKRQPSEWKKIISNEATDSIFQRTRTNNFTVCVEIQKMLNRQSNLEKEEWSWSNQPS